MRDPHAGQGQPMDGTPRTSEVIEKVENRGAPEGYANKQPGNMGAAPEPGAEPDTAREPNADAMIAGGGGRPAAGQPGDVHPGALPGTVATPGQGPADLKGVSAPAVHAASGTSEELPVAEGIRGGGIARAPKGHADGEYAT
ncbi:MAG: hypothetical protein M3P91_09940 [Actinomycetota bacterium]|nr:hypothetical protein [Actinomycetota bacterium]